ncbi:hypothetical protein AFLA_010178 [Aspergillus flavus NRRL3357]|nr:hypothetical protein AFLA_010178 [Aspergillus flavus NRRL3357]
MIPDGFTNLSHQITRYERVSLSLICVSAPNEVKAIGYIAPERLQFPVLNQGYFTGLYGHVRDIYTLDTRHSGLRRNTIQM